MEENAQLRAEKMLTASNPPSSNSVVNNVSLNMNNVFYNPPGTQQQQQQQPDELGLYSTVKNKKFSMLKEHMHNNDSSRNNANVHNFKLNTFRASQEDERSSEIGNLTTDSPTHRSAKANQLSKKVYLTIESSSDSSNDLNMASKSAKSNMSCMSDNMFDW